jgi:hypothetical protein
MGVAFKWQLTVLNWAKAVSKFDPGETPVTLGDVRMETKVTGGEQGKL